MDFFSNAVGGPTGKRLQIISELLDGFHWDSVVCGYLGQFRRAYSMLHWLTIADSDSTNAAMTLQTKQASILGSFQEGLFPLSISS